MGNGRLAVEGASLLSMLSGAGAVRTAVAQAGKTAVKGGTGAVNTGKLVGSIDNLTATEQSFVKEMVAGGKTVEIIPTATGRTADFFIDGTRYELKTMSNVVNQTSDGLSSALSSTIMNARGQSGNIIIDARGQAGMTAEIAERGIGRALGADARAGAKIQNITVITSEGTIAIPRKP
jgi:filamentous hemagglutinin